MVAVEIERTVPTLIVTSCACAERASRTPAPMARRQASRPRHSMELIRFSPARVTALFGRHEIASLAVAIETFLAQRIERTHDLAPIAAAHRRHELLEEFRAVGERRFE